LKNKEWSFPLIGTFSYKGFFDHERAIAEKAELISQGYDTGIRTTTAWSTLGYFKDPILSGFLSRSEGEIANTVIHELTHGTVFVKDSLQFNENIATFFGNKGAEAFLTQKYGADSEEYQTYIGRMHDREIYTQHILRGARKLDSLYHDHAFAALDEAEKQLQKKTMIRHIIHCADTLSLRDKPRYARLFQRYLQPDSLPNNTFFMSYMRYRGKLDALEEECGQKFDNNIKSYLQYLEEKY
jgi:predicted aminopeptidase